MAIAPWFRANAVPLGGGLFVKFGVGPVASVGLLPAGPIAVTPVIFVVVVGGVIEPPPPTPMLVAPLLPPLEQAASASMLADAKKTAQKLDFMEAPARLWLTYQPKA